MENDMELQFQKLCLEKEDVLIIKVDSENQTANDVIEKMATVRNDEFVKFVQDKGNPVLVVNSGISFEILRKKENDRVIVYLDVSSMTEDQSDAYENIIKTKLQESLGDNIICVPVKSKTSMKIKSEEENGD